MLNYVILGMGLLILICLVFTPNFIHLVAPGFSGDTFDQTVVLTRIILLAQMFLAPANMLTGVLNANKRFFWSYLAPLFYNFGLIVGVVWLYDIYGLLGLGYGVILGALANFLCLLIALLFTGFRWEFSLAFDSGIKKAFRLYVPRLLMLDLTQVGLLLATFFGSWLVAGSISFFNLGFDLQAVPVGVLGEVLAHRIFHVFARHDLLRDRDGRVFLEMDFARLRLEQTGQHLENRALAGAVLAHERDLRAFAHGKIHLVQEGLLLVIPEGDAAEAENDVPVIHKKSCSKTENGRSCKGVRLRKTVWRPRGRLVSMARDAKPRSRS
jgi:hypothetical protein